jgi:lipopolysaccharide/colanic/teichoic acid biosynthesis glycosyltransferase
MGVSVSGSLLRPANLVMGAGRLAHRVAAAALLLLVAPLLLLLWVAVRLETPGAGFHVSTRVGPDGTPFGMVSLRTMREGAGSLADVLAEQAEELTASGMSFLVRRDPRVTRVGYWLRRWSLDELPRLVNVLRGEMTLRGAAPLRSRDLDGATAP